MDADPNLRFDCLMRKRQLAVNHVIHVGSAAQLANGAKLHWLTGSVLSEGEPELSPL
jgi:hypothetical protein